MLLSPLLLAALPAIRVADDPRPALSSYNLEGGVALSGYDPVAYFLEGGGEPRKGKASVTQLHAGVTYRFASEENRDLFRADPERYEPAFGGWCAWAMVDGERVEVDPESFLVENGRLFVFYDGFFADTRKKWLRKGGEELAPKADSKWRGISGEEPRLTLRHQNLPGGVALQGFDPVLYREGRASAGRPELAETHAGLTYFFADASTRERFRAEPERFGRAYGGWCAWAMARGKKVEVDPLAYLVDGDGALLLFYDAAKRDAWRADPSLRAEADAAWRKLIGG